MFRNIDIAICYEVVQREYAFYYLLKLELEKRGYSVKMFNNFWVDYWKRSFFKPKMIICSGMRSDDELVYNITFRGKSFKLFNLCCEQIIGKSEEKDFYYRPKESALDAYHVCWGPAAYKRATEKWGVNAEQLIKVGAIQFDFLKGELKNIYMSKKELASKFHLDAEKKWILFNSNFYDALLEDRNLWDAEREAVLQSQYESFFSIVKWWKKFLPNYPDYLIIYRPHPSIFHTAKCLEELQLQYDNFVIIRDLSVQQWCLAADLVNIWNSTSAVDAYFSGTPTIGLGDLSGAKEIGENDEILDESTYIHTYDEYVEAITNQELWKHHRVLDFDIYEAFYGYTGDSYVYLRMCDEIERVFENGKSIKRIRPSEFMQNRIKHYKKITFKTECILRCPKWLEAILKRANMHYYNVIQEVKHDLRRFDKKNLNDLENKIRKCYEKIV